MKLPAFEYLRPASLAEAIQILSDGEGAARAIAGGQSLIPIMAFRLAKPSVLVDLAGIVGLDQISITEAGISIGSMVCWRELEEHRGLRAACLQRPQGLNSTAARGAPRFVRRPPVGRQRRGEALP